jgi:hypothetical protein
LAWKRESFKPLYNKPVEFPACPLLAGKIFVLVTSVLLMAEHLKYNQITINSFDLLDPGNGVRKAPASRVLGMKGS